VNNGPIGPTGRWCQANGTDFGELVVTNTPKELRHIAQGCRVSRLPWECVQETHLPRMGYVKNDDGTPLGYRRGIVQTQGSSLREQPWALRRNSVGVEEHFWIVSIGSWGWCD